MCVSSTRYGYSTAGPSRAPAITNRQLPFMGIQAGISSAPADNRPGAPADPAAAGTLQQKSLKCRRKDAELPVS